MKIRNYLFVNLFVWLFLFDIGRVTATEVVIIKSNDIVPYNKAVVAFRQAVRSETAEFDLQGDRNEFDFVLKEIRNESPKLIFAIGTLAAIEAKERISDIPIVYSLVLAPETKDLIGNNLTGISIEVSSQEQFKVIKNLVPGIKTIGVLYSHLTEDMIVKANKACQMVGLKLLPREISKQEDVPEGIKTLIAKADVLWLIPDSIVISKDSLQFILLLTLENKKPLLVYSKNFVKAGALLSLGVDFADIGRQAGRLVEQYLQGKELPNTILPPSDIELSINLNTSQNLGLKIPEELLKEFRYIYK